MHFTTLRRRGAAILAALALGASLLAVTAAPAGAAPAPSHATFGVALPGVPQGLQPLRALASSVGAMPGTVMWYEQWSSAADFPAAEATAVVKAGSQPEITWEPWNPSDGVDQPAYSLASIASGAHDAYLRRWAEEIKAWGGTLRLRFAQEMNGNWYPWGEGVNGNRAGSYVAAWRHVHQVFAAAGVHNVVWVWSPNVVFPGSTSLASLWPGAGEVGAVALDGYNWGPTSTGSRWQSFASIFSPSIAAIRAITSLPMYIGEVGCGETGGDKASWITAMFATLSQWPTVRGFTWFDFNKEEDWRIDSSPSALAAFRSGVTRYAG